MGVLTQRIRGFDVFVGIFRICTRVEGGSHAGRKTKFAPVKSFRFSQLFLGILLSEFRSSNCALWSGFMNDVKDVY